MARKKVLQEDMPVDKMDAFIKNNYKTIITAVGLVIGVFIVGYAIYAFTEKSRIQKYAFIGQSEMRGFYSTEQVEEFASLANTYKFADNYINFRAAESLAELGEKSEADTYLARVGGEFKEFAQSLAYDLNPDGNVEAHLYKSGIFAPVWYYRAVLAAGDDSRHRLMEDFRADWPDSALLAQLEKWGY